MGVFFSPNVRLDVYYFCLTNMISITLSAFIVFRSTFFYRYWNCYFNMHPNVRRRLDAGLCPVVISS